MSGRNFHSALYRGELMHARHDRFARAFRYPVYMAAIDPAELAALDRELRLFSLGRWNAFSLDARDYTTPISSDARDDATPISSDPRDATLPAIGTTRLVTNLRAFGYVFNPVSFFLRYRANELATVSAEVNNTYGGRRCYELGAAERLADDHERRADDHRRRAGAARAIGFRTARDFFVSPFLHGELVYDWWFDAPLDGEHLSIEMFVHHADTGRRALTARFTGTRVPLSDRTLAAAAVRYPVMAAQVIGLIHWQALKLRVLGAPYHRPGPDHRPIS